MFEKIPRCSCHRPVPSPEAGLPSDLGEDGEGVLRYLAVPLLALDLHDLLQLLLLVLAGRANERRKGDGEPMRDKEQKTRDKGDGTPTGYLCTGDDDGSVQQIQRQAMGGGVTRTPVYRISYTILVYSIY